MAHPLDGVALKIVWAEKHLERVKNEIQRYIQTDPHELRTKQDIHGRWALAPEITIQPSDTLSLTVGDCLTNTRAALDHLMFQCCLKWFDPPFDVENRTHRMVTSFPIFEKSSTDPQSAEKNRLSQLAKFMPNRPANLLDIIKSVQPYNSGYQPMWWLHELVNTDKHRLLLVTRSDIPAASFWFTYQDRTVSSPSLSTGYYHADILRLGGLSTQTIGAELPEGVNVKYKPTIHVTLKDPPMPVSTIKNIPVDSVLQQIIETVLTVIPQFDKFF